MPFMIPLRPDSTHFETAVAELDDATYSMEFRWNTRNSTWYMHVKTEDNDMIAAGIAVVIGWPLGSLVTDLRFPPGVLVAVDTSGRLEEAGETDLGERVKLFYFTADEVLAVEVAADAIEAGA